MHTTPATMGEVLMRYYGWEVIEDPMYHRLLKDNRDITTADQDKMSHFIDKYIESRRTVLDIGCHYGFFTNFLAKRFQQVHAFDFPNDILECCKSNLEGIKNITIHEHGVGDRNTQVSTNDWSTRHGRRGPLGNHVDPNNQGVKYPIKTIDSLNITDVDLMMIDTEGYEMHVLKGAVNTIKKYQPLLVLEFHNRNLTQKYGYSLLDLQAHVESLGYRSLGYINKVDQVFVSEAKA